MPILPKTGMLGFFFSCLPFSLLIESKICKCIAWMRLQQQTERITWLNTSKFGLCWTNRFSLESNDAACSLLTNSTRAFGTNPNLKLHKNLKREIYFHLCYPLWKDSEANISESSRYSCMPCDPNALTRSPCTKKGAVWTNHITKIVNGIFRFDWTRKFDTSLNRSKWNRYNQFIRRQILTLKNAFQESCFFLHTTSTSCSSSSESETSLDSQKLVFA